VEHEQFLKRRFVADLAADHERLFVECLRSYGHVCLQSKLPGGDEKFIHPPRFAGGSREGAIGIVDDIVLLLLLVLGFSAFSRRRTNRKDKL